ncbi:MAG: D-alanine--D-alanine ligase family protein, partial [Actinomycetota bacterium]
FGGRSGEHEVSCVSARHVAAALDPERYEVIPIGITREGRWMLPDASRTVLEGGALEIPPSAFEADGLPVTIVHDPGRMDLVALHACESAPEERPSLRKIDVAFPVLHGPFGEDGTVQGLFELAGIPYVGAGVLGSALGMDKEKMKRLFRSEGLPTVDFVVLRAPEWSLEQERLLKEAEALGFPCFTKPANLGSSIGISKCCDAASLVAGIEEAFRHDRKVLVEEAIPGREVECGVLGNDFPEASLVGEILPGRDFYDYVAKYVDQSSEVVIPAHLPEAIVDLVREYALTAFRAIDAAGMARVDFFYEEGGRGVVVNEINTIPGFTPISMFAKLWDATGIAYPQMIDRLISLALERHRARPRSEDIPPPRANRARQGGPGPARPGSFD